MTIQRAFALPSSPARIAECHSFQVQNFAEVSVVHDEMSDVGSCINTGKIIECERRFKYNAAMPCKQRMGSEIPYWPKYDSPVR